jgi:hypothetical protein
MHFKASPCKKVSKTPSQSIKTWMWWQVRVSPTMCKYKQENCGSDWPKQKLETLPEK